MKKYLLLFSLLTALSSFAQSNKQKIRGVVIDKLSQTTLPGATDDRSKSITTTYQLGFFPNFIYKIQF